MIDPNHKFTVHPTYTGAGCAHCGRGKDQHPQDETKDEKITEQIDPEVIRMQEAGSRCLSRGDEGCQAG